MNEIKFRFESALGTLSRNSQIYRSVRHVAGQVLVFHETDKGQIVAKCALYVGKINQKTHLLKIEPFRQLCNVLKRIVYANAMECGKIDGYKIQRRGECGVRYHGVGRTWAGPKNTFELAQKQLKIIITKRI